MPYTVPVSFDQFLENITLTGDHKDTAEARRKRLVELLKNDFTILNSFPTGSIPKGTALKSHADLDIFVVLHWGKHIKGQLPSRVLKSVQEALSGYTTSVRRNGQAVTLTYTSWPNVDIVPVSQSDNNDGTVNHYSVPDMNTETWISSRPRRHASNVSAAAATCGYRFLPLIRMIKEWNRTHSELMSSYHIEVLATKVCTTTIDSYPWAIYHFFDEAAKLAKASLWYEDAYCDAYLETDGRAEVIKRLATARDRAATAWYKTYPPNTDDKGAIDIWRQIFGGRFPSHG